MKLTVGDAHNILIGLHAFEAPDLKLSGDTRFKIAVAINRLRRIGTNYERERAMAHAAFSAGKTGFDPSLQSKVMEKDHELRAAEVEVKLSTFCKDELKLHDNTQITPQAIANIMLLIADADRDD